MESNYWARLNRRRLSRRSLLAAGGTAALGVGAAAVVGCGGGGSSFTRTSGTPYGGAQNGPIPGGIVTIGRPLPVLGIDPHIDLTGLDILPLLYSYLYSWNASTEEAVFNNFAESVEMPSEDYAEFIFALRRGVKVQSQEDNPAKGEELTSEDVKQSFIRRGTVITAPDKRFPLRISGTTSVALRTLLQTPDPYTFSFRMSKPFVPALGEMADPTWAIVPAKVIEKYGNFQVGGLGQKAWGSGPFMMTEFEREERIILRRHPEYFLAPRPWVDEVRYEIVTDAEKLLEAFDSREHDVCGAILSRAEAEERMRNNNLVISRAPAPFYPVVRFRMNLPFADIRLREAFDLALDREEVIELIWDSVGNYNGPVPWVHDRFSLSQDELRAAMPNNLDRARQLLAAAGYESGLEQTMKMPRIPGVPSAGKLAALIKEQVARVGIKLVLEEVDRGSFIANVLLPGNFDIAFVPDFSAEGPDRALSLYRSRRTRTYPGPYQDPQLDELIEAQESEFDEQKRIEIILRAQRLILKEHGPQLTLPSGYSYSAHWNYVHNPYQPQMRDGENQGGPPGTDVWTEKASA